MRVCLFRVTPGNTVVSSMLPRCLSTKQIRQMQRAPRYLKFLLNSFRFHYLPICSHVFVGAIFSPSCTTLGLGRVGTARRVFRGPQPGLPGTAGGRRDGGPSGDVTLLLAVGFTYQDLSFHRIHSYLSTLCVVPVFTFRDRFLCLFACSFFSCCKLCLSYSSSGRAAGIGRGSHPKGHHCRPTRRSLPLVRSCAEG